MQKELVGLWIVVGMLVVPFGALAGSALAASPNAVRSPNVVPLVNPTNISFASSYDSWPLSYLEYTPAGYSGAASPLVVFLPGLGTSTANVSGGVGASTVPLQLINNASTFGFLLISVNTRSTAGYYLNTPCGGHQQQDILDAIASEESRRTVTNVYLVGFSGGSAGALALAGQHLVANLKGVATSATITDMSSTLYYDVYNNSDNGHYGAFVRDECGQAPSWVNPSGNGGQVPNRAAAQLFQLDTFRYYPSNFTGLKLFLAGGGKDTEAMDNTSLYGFANLNSTVMGQYSSVGCTRDTGDLPVPPAYSLGAPLINLTTGITSYGCETPYVNLTQRPSFTYQYDAQGVHSSIQPNYQDVFQYWQGYRVGGVFTSTFPVPTVLTPKVFAYEGFPTITNVPTVACGTGAGANSPAVNSPTGQSIYVFDAMLTSTRWITTVTDTAGDTFHLVKNVTVAGVEKEELWVVNATTGSSVNVVSATNSAAATTCISTVTVKGVRTSASYDFLGTSTQATNTTAGDPFSTATARDLILSWTDAPAAEVYSPLYTWAMVAQHNVSTTLSAGLAFENQIAAGASLSQITVGTSANWESLSVAIQAQPVPTAPTLTVVGITKTTYNLTIGAPSGGGVTNYTLWLGTNSSGIASNCVMQEAVSLGISTLHYNLASGFGGFITVGSGMKVCLRISAWNSTGMGVLSSFTNFTLNGTVQGGSGGTGGGGGIGLGGFVFPPLTTDGWLLLGSIAATLLVGVAIIATRRN